MAPVIPEKVPPPDMSSMSPYPPQFPPMLETWSAVVEVVYFIFIISLCIAIYYRTKEIYDLTQHTGLYFFRNFFIFFALSSIFRVLNFSSLFRFSMMTLDRMLFLDKICMFLMVYCGTIAFISLAISILVRNHDIESRNVDLINVVLHLSTLLVVVPVFYAKLIPPLLISLTGLFMATLIYDIVNEYKAGKRIFSKNRITNILLFVFWILNIQFYINGILPRELSLLIFLISGIIFFSIYLRIRKIYLINQGDN